MVIRLYYTNALQEGQACAWLLLLCTCQLGMQKSSGSVNMKQLYEVQKRRLQAAHFFGLSKLAHIPCVTALLLQPATCTVHEVNMLYMLYKHNVPCVDMNAYEQFLSAVHHGIALQRTHPIWSIKTRLVQF